MRFLPSLMMTVPTAAPMLPLIPQNLLILLILHRLLVHLLISQQTSFLSVSNSLQYPKTTVEIHV